MKTFTTHLYAINPDTQELQRFDGLKVQAKSWEEAELYCAKNDLGYLVIDGVLEGEYKEDNMVKVVGNNLN